MGVVGVLGYFNSTKVQFGDLVPYLPDLPVPISIPLRYNLEEFVTSLKPSWQIFQFH